MSYSDEVLSRIWDRTGGECHLCGGRLTFMNHGKLGRAGAWEVDHSRAHARGGTDHGNNLWPAHIPCNREKSIRTSGAARATYGLTRAPLSKEQRRRAQEQKDVIVALGLGVFAVVAYRSLLRLWSQSEHSLPGAEPDFSAWDAAGFTED
jgi:hypothetical protein